MDRFSTLQAKKDRDDADMAYKIREYEKVDWIYN